MFFSVIAAAGGPRPARRGALAALVILALPLVALAPWGLRRDHEGRVLPLVTRHVYAVNRVGFDSAPGGQGRPNGCVRVTETMVDMYPCLLFPHGFTRGWTSETASAPAGCDGAETVYPGGP